MRFLMIDRITDLVAGQSATGVKNVSLSEDVFTDHFPGRPIMPGTLMLEGMAQLAGILLEESAPSSTGARPKALLTIVERAKFRAPVYPGDQLIYKAELLSINETGGRLTVSGTVQDRLCAECQLVFCFAEAPGERLAAKQREIVGIWTRELAGRR